MDGDSPPPIFNNNDEIFGDAQQKLAELTNTHGAIFSSKVLELHHIHSFQSIYLQSVDYLHEISIQTRQQVIFFLYF